MLEGVAALATRRLPAPTAIETKASISVGSIT